MKPQQILDLEQVLGLTLTEGSFYTKNTYNINKVGDIIALNLEQNNITDIGCLKDFTKLTRLDLNHNQISDINAVAGLTNLTTLSLYHNQIRDINAVAGLTNLTKLWLSHNQISDINAVAGLTNLTELSLYQNQISDINAVAGLTNLTTLWLSQNQISDINAVAGLTNLTELSLYQNQISDINAVAGLTNLTELSLYQNQISDINAVAGLTNLIELSLSQNQISDINAVAGLTNLTKLYLYQNQISDINAVAGLTNLTELYLYQNQISDINAVAGLTNLTELWLSHNQISDINAVAGLTNLTTLWLYHNQISDINAVAGLTNLTVLWLSQNQISDINAVAGLTNLTELYLHQNQISDINAVVGLTNLTKLYLSQNQISDINAVAGLTNLTELGLHHNQISDINAVAGLTNLKALSLSNNKISIIDDLSNWIKLEELYLSNNLITDISILLPFIEKSMNLALDFKREYDNDNENKNKIFIDHNPLSKNLISAIKSSREAVIEYLSEGKRDYLYEARLIIVGEPRAGKTSLQRKIKKNTAKLPNETDSTKGININIESLECKVRQDKAHDGATNRKLKYHIWDFGGQEMYKLLHQLFISEQALYIIVIDTDRNKNEEELEFWLETIERLACDKEGTHSPVILFQNAKTDRKERGSFRQLRERFPFWQQEEDVFINLNQVGNKTSKNYSEKSAQSFKTFKATLESKLSNLKHIGEEIPASWGAVRRALDTKYANHNYISLQEYRSVCISCGITDPAKQLRLSRTLHILGVFIHYQDEEHLKDLIILQKTWVTDALYRVLDSKIVDDNDGSFNLKDAAEIWNDEKYQDKSVALLGVMEQFKMTYKLRNKKQYIVPTKLPYDEPIGQIWDKTDNVILYLQYDWLPRPVIIQLIVSLHQHIAKGQKWVWRSGCVIEGKELDAADAMAHISEPRGKNRIEIRVRGNRSEYLIKSIMDKWREVNEPYKDKLDTKRIIVCQCDTCQTTFKSNPHSFRFDQVLNAKDKNQDLQCNNSLESLSPLEILKGVFSPETANELKEKRNNHFHFKLSDDVDEKELMWRTVEPIGYAENTLQNFKKALFIALDNSQQNAISDILIQIQQSNYDYDKVLYTSLKNQMTPTAQAMTPHENVNSTKTLINSLNLKK